MHVVVMLILFISLVVFWVLIVPHYYLNFIFVHDCLQFLSCCFRLRDVSACKFLLGYFM